MEEPLHLLCPHMFVGVTLHQRSTRWARSSEMPRGDDALNPHRQSPSSEQQALESPSTQSYQREATSIAESHTALRSPGTRALPEPSITKGLGQHPAWR